MTYDESMEFVLSNHAAKQLAAFGDIEVWRDNRTGLVELFAVDTRLESDEPLEVSAEAQEMMMKYNAPPEPQPRPSGQQLAAAFVAAWLLLACTTTTLLAFLMYLRFQ